MIDSGTIQRHIYGARLEAEGCFKRQSSPLLETVETDLANIFRIMFWTITYNDEMRCGPQFEALSLFNRASEALISSLHLVRQRAYLDGLTLLRVSMESACTGVYIYEDASAWQEYSAAGSGKFKATQSITYAKRHVEIVGRVWGAMSGFLHPNWHAFGSLVGQDGGLELVIGGSRGSGEEDQLSLVLISLASGVLLKAMEVVLLEPAMEDSKFLRVPGSKIRLTPMADDLIKDRFRSIDRMFQEGGTTDLGGS